VRIAGAQEPLHGVVAVGRGDDVVAAFLSPDAAEAHRLPALDDNLVYAGAVADPASQGKVLLLYRAGEG